MGIIRQINNGKYQCDVRDHLGKRIRIVFSSYQDAKDYVTVIENQKLEHRRINLGLSTSRATINDSIAEFIKTKQGLRSKSLKKYYRSFHQLKEYCKDIGLIYTNEFTRDHADQFWGGLTEINSSPKTNNFKLMAVKSLFTYEVNHERILVNPFSHIKALKQKSKSQTEREEEYYTEEEINAFLNVEMKSEDRNVFEASLLTGLRISELQSLKWETSIDLNTKMIKVRNYEGYETKTSNSERDIPMTDNVYNMLSGIKKAEGYVFTTDNGDRVSERTLLTVCKRIAEEAGIKKNATLHKWRHTFATHAANTEITYEERQYLLGHSPASQTDRYTKVDPKKLHQKLSELDKLIG